MIENLINFIVKLSSFLGNCIVVRTEKFYMTGLKCEYLSHAGGPEEAETADSEAGGRGAWSAARSGGRLLTLMTRGVCLSSSTWGCVTLRHRAVFICIKPFFELVIIDRAQSKSNFNIFNLI